MLEKMDNWYYFQNTLQMEKEDLQFKIIGIQKFFKIRSSVTPLLAKRAVTSWKTKYNLRLQHVMATYLSIDNSKINPFSPLPVPFLSAHIRLHLSEEDQTAILTLQRQPGWAKFQKMHETKSKNIIRKNIESKVSVFISKAYWAMAWYGSWSSWTTSVSMDKEIVDKYIHLKTSLNI